MSTTSTCTRTCVVDAISYLIVLLLFILCSGFRVALVHTVHILRATISLLLTLYHSLLFSLLFSSFLPPFLHEVSFDLISISIFSFRSRAHVVSPFNHSLACSLDSPNHLTRSLAPLTQSFHSLAHSTRPIISLHSHRVSVAHTQINGLLDRSAKSYIKTVVCYPQLSSKMQFLKILHTNSSPLKDSERVHINLLATCARKQAGLLYAMRAVSQLMARRE